MTLKETALWVRFTESASPKQVAMVEAATKGAAQYLKLIRDTFPTYTLHDETHSLNVVRMMGELLGERIDELRPLESAILILSAYLHDAGMVFHQEDLQAISDEDAFHVFLNENPRAAVLRNEAKRKDPTNPIPDEVAEWYCRWSHHMRVRHALSAMKIDLNWDNISIKRQLTKVCESHGLAARKLDPNILHPNFKAGADLLFCAVMLRLADILDFDRTRSPKVIYDYLKLPEVDRGDSDREWRKHYASSGFSFSGSALVFNASPDKPPIEYDIREFLTTIERELGESRAALNRYASDSWRNLDLPTEVDKQITSVGYQYGEHRFTLEQNQVLELFMGENLYSDANVFVRELVQNAVDTSRHRIIFEEAHGKRGYKPHPINLSTWIDKDGYRWVRIDDYGMGMEEGHIVDYMLRVGVSYYGSHDFQAEIGQYTEHAKQEIDFLPVSRFGIGLLSCFVVGDMLEISTRHVPPSHFVTENRPKALRLTMDGLQSFYTLRVSGEHNCHPMPNPESSDEQYRRSDEYGTSIAVRLSPRKSFGHFDLVRILKKIVLTSPIPIEVDGERIDFDYEQTMQHPWIPKRIEIELAPEEYCVLEELIERKFVRPPKIVWQPLNFTSHTVSKYLHGQGLYVAMVLPDADSQIHHGVSFSLPDVNPLNIKFSYRNAALLERIRVEAKVMNLLLEFGIWLKERRTEDMLSNEQESAISNCRGAFWLANELKIAPFTSYTGFFGEIRHSALRDPFVRIHLQELLSDIVVNLDTFAHTDKSDAGLTKLIGQCLEVSDLVSDWKEQVVMASAPLELNRSLDKIHALLGPRRPTDNRRYGLDGELRQGASHNGLIIPWRSMKIMLTRNHEWLSYHFSLFDRMRPDISLSRDTLRSMPWSFYSAFVLTARRTFRAGFLDDHRVDMDPQRETNDRTLTHTQFGSLRDDPLITSNVGWYKERIFDTDHGFISMEEILSQFDDTELTINVPLNWYSASVNWIIGKALIQIHLDVELVLLERSRWYIPSELKVNTARENPPQPTLLDGLEHWPPLSFVHYVDEKHLIISHTLPINLSHPFAQWLVKNTVSLRKLYPGLLERVRTSLQGRVVRYLPDNFDSTETCLHINSVLKRLLELNYADALPEGKFLTVDDFKYEE